MHRGVDGGPCDDASLQLRPFAKLSTTVEDNIAPSKEIATGPDLLLVASTFGCSGGCGFAAPSSF